MMSSSIRFFSVPASLHVFPIWGSCVLTRLHAQRLKTCEISVWISEKLTALRTQCCFCGNEHCILSSLRHSALPQFGKTGVRFNVCVTARRLQISHLSTQVVLLMCLHLLPFVTRVAGSHSFGKFRCYVVQVLICCTPPDGPERGRLFSKFGVRACMTTRRFQFAHLSNDPFAVGCATNAAAAAPAVPAASRMRSRQSSNTFSIR